MYSPTRLKQDSKSMQALATMIAAKQFHLTNCIRLLFSNCTSRRSILTGYSPFTLPDDCCNVSQRLCFSVKAYWVGSVQRRSFSLCSFVVIYSPVESCSFHILLSCVVFVNWNQNYNKNIPIDKIQLKKQTKNRQIRSIRNKVCFK